MRTGELPDPTPPAVVPPLEQIGKPLARPDAVDKVTGKALYADDFHFDGMLHAATLRSEHATRPHPAYRHRGGAQACRACMPC